MHTKQVSLGLGLKNELLIALQVMFFGFVFDCVNVSAESCQILFPLSK